jgi:hypothetical protein
MTRNSGIMGLCLSLSIVLAMFGFAATAARARRIRSGEAQAEEGICSGLKGMAYGLCNKYCTVMDCDTSEGYAKHSSECDKALANFKTKKDGEYPPCVACENCPCDFPAWPIDACWGGPEDTAISFTPGPLPGTKTYTCSLTTTDRKRGIEITSCPKDDEHCEAHCSMFYPPQPSPECKPGLNTRYMKTGITQSEARSCRTCLEQYVSKGISEGYNWKYPNPPGIACASPE